MKHLHRSLPALFLAAVVALPGCSLFDGLTGEDSKSNATVRTFTATPNPVRAGAAVLLEWDVAGAESIQIDNGIGIVAEKGRREIFPLESTTFTITAREGKSTTMSRIDVVVLGSYSTPTPTPTPAPTPTPTPEPTPTPDPTPEPTPSTCGVPPSAASGCAVTVEKPVELPDGECIELKTVNLSRACPVGIATTRALAFRIRALTSATNLQWRRAVTSSDLLSPAGGDVDSEGATDVAVTQTVLDRELAIEVVDGSRVLLRFTIANY